MKFPDAPTCHDVSAVFKLGSTVWRDPKDDGKGSNIISAYRTCSNCGSIHPEDLLTISRLEGFSLGGSDWKYGWPHKFYLTAASPFVGTTREMGGTYKDGSFTPLMSAASMTLNGKWYNEHLKDKGFDDEAFAAVTELLERTSRIRFELRDDRLAYSAPYAGYQVP